MSDKNPSTYRVFTYNDAGWYVWQADIDGKPQEYLTVGEASEAAWDAWGEDGHICEVLTPVVES